ncbi:hypothetical protein PA25_38430 [Pseudoalteromonas sp. A25]|nr:hypothetical protein PA25_38430 [Pseudoalteromonas sp. A25]
MRLQALCIEIALLLYGYPNLSLLGMKAYIYASKYHRAIVSIYNFLFIKTSFKSEHNEKMKGVFSIKSSII